MSVPEVTLMTFVDEKMTSDQLEELGRKIISWYEKEKADGYDVHYDVRSVEKLLQGQLPSPIQTHWEEGPEGRVMVMEPAHDPLSSGIGNPSKLHVGSRIVFLAYDPSPSPDATGLELRLRAELALGRRVVGGSMDDECEGCEEETDEAQ